MKTIDLTSGQKAQSIYDLSNYHIRFTNPAFSIDDNGVISFDRSRIAEDVYKRQDRARYRGYDPVCPVCAC